jgi:hypothetical protein
MKEIVTSPGSVRTAIPSRRLAASAALAGVAVVHVAWGVGSSFPFRDRATLADSVIGDSNMPGSVACHSVAGSLFIASALTADVPWAPRRVRRIGRMVVSAVLTGRGLVGLGGRTYLISPASTSPRFRRLDRAIYSPLCLAIAAGVATGHDY